MKILIQYVLNIKVTKEIVMNPMITIVVLGLLWLVIVFPLYLHYRKEISIRSKSTSLISGKVVGYNSTIYSRHGELPKVALPIVEYTVRGKQYRKSLKYKRLIPASSGKIQKDVFSSDYVYSSDRSLDLKKYFPSAQIWSFTIILRILKKPMLSAASAMKSILNICLSDYLFSFSFWLELIFSVYFCSLKSLFLDIEW